MVEQLDYETPQPAKRRPFLPPGWTATDAVIFLVFVFSFPFGDSYLARMGWPWWARAAALGSVGWATFWLLAKYRRRA
jgi:hypothetical protein